MQVIRGAEALNNSSLSIVFWCLALKHQSSGTASQREDKEYNLAYEGIIDLLRMSKSLIQHYQGLIQAAYSYWSILKQKNLAFFFCRDSV